MREKAEKNYFAERGISSMSRNLFKSQESYRRTAMSEKGAEQLLKIRAIVSKLLCGPEPLLETGQSGARKLQNTMKQWPKLVVFATGMEPS